jgi:hypothetical protein
MNANDAWWVISVKGEAQEPHNRLIGQPDAIKLGEARGINGMIPPYDLGVPPGMILDVIEFRGNGIVVRTLWKLPPTRS